MSDVPDSSARCTLVAVPRMIEFLIVTFGAVTLTKPWMSRPSMTAPARAMVRSPSCRFSTVPFGTPVFVGVRAARVPTAGAAASGRAAAVGPAQTSATRAAIGALVIPDAVYVFTPMPPGTCRAAVLSAR